MKRQKLISVFSSIFQGEEIPAGPIRFGDLIDNFPHFSKWGDAGWSISRAYISGLILTQVLKYLGSGDQPFDATIDGIQAWDKEKGKAVPYLSGFHKAEDALIEGKAIKNSKFYSVALPSEIPYAVGKMSPLIRDLLLVHSKKVENSNFWPLFENYIAKNSPLKCLAD